MLKTKIQPRLAQPTHNTNTHRMQVHESVLCSVGLGVHYFVLGAGSEN
jgi:hypothetical protein